MHYPYTVYTGGKPLIIPIDPLVDAEWIGGLFLSLADILEIRRHYGCIPSTINTIDIAIQSLFATKYIVADIASFTPSGSDPTDSSQQYTVSFNDDTTVSFKSIKYGTYLSVNTNDSPFLIPSQTTVVSDNEKFYMISRDSVSFFLKAKANGKYVSVGIDGTSALIANVTTAGSSERFFRTIL